MKFNLFVHTALFALLCLSSASLGADLRPLNGKPISGELVSFNTKEIVLKTATGPVTTSLSQVLQLDLEPMLGPAKDAKYQDVELTDGTLLHCGQFAIKGKQVELTLLSGQQIKAPLEAVSYLLNDAQDEKNRQDWKERFLGEKRTTDLIALRGAGARPTGLKGTFGDGSDDGKSISFDRNSAGSPVMVKLERVHGMIFQRQPPAEAPAVLCKVYDTAQNYLVASSVTLDDKGFTITTAAGVKVEYAAKLIHRLDFSKGKLTFLADLDPASVKESSTEERVEHYRRNKNLDDQKIHLREPKEATADPTKVAPQDTVLKEYENGLALHSRTELEYDLKGDYNEFKATVGVDETVGGSDGTVVIKIEGDGKELYTANFTRKDLARPVGLSVKGVNRLRIVVSSGDLLDLGKHLTLAEARVSK